MGSKKLLALQSVTETKIILDVLNWDQKCLPFKLRTKGIRKMEFDPGMGLACSKTVLISLKIFFQSQFHHINNNVVITIKIKGWMEYLADKKGT